MTRFSTAAASPNAASQDRAAVIPLGPSWILALADGTGGVSGGAHAAQLFIDGIHHAAVSGLDPTAFPTLLHHLDHQIASDPHGGETTGIALAVTPGHLVGASCGDSRAYLFTPTTSLELTSAQHRKPRLGTGRAVAEAFTAPTTGTLVVASDGLVDYAPLADIQRIALTAGDDAADSLVRLVRDRYRTLPDDIVIIVGIDIADAGPIEV